MPGAFHMWPAPRAAAGAARARVTASVPYAAPFHSTFKQNTVQGTTLTSKVQRRAERSGGLVVYNVRHNPRTDKHRKVLYMARGFPPPYGKVFRRAMEAVRRYWWQETEGRRHLRKERGRVRMMRIAAACERYGMPYRMFIHGLRLRQVKLNRPMLAMMALYDPPAFQYVATMASKALVKKAASRRAMRQRYEDFLCAEIKKVRDEMREKGIWDERWNSDRFRHL